MLEKNLENPSCVSKAFTIGNYRPIYMWAGPGTVRMNRLKFMNVKVDKTVHLQAHTLEGARRVVSELNCNWAHLTYNWGFPPEIEHEDWESFREAAIAYHQSGSPVFAYFQSSNCVYSGSYKEKNWYALDPSGNPITYFTYGGRFMVCFLSQAWRENLKTLVEGALERGADGIFFDNLFFGSQPLSAFGSFLGSAGCFCPRCKDAYYQYCGKEIPSTLIEDSRQLSSYLRWRANQVSDFIQDIANYARSIKPGVSIAANDFDPILRNSFLIYGIDLERLSQIQDVVMIENFGLPRWEPGLHSLLVNNAATVRTAQRIVARNAHLSVLSYDVGIGFDHVYSSRRYLQALSEASALGVSMTIKGTEYFDGEKMTLLTADEYSDNRQVIGNFHHWLETNKEKFSPKWRNLAQIGLFFPGEELWLQWPRLAPYYFGVCQTLTTEGYPWRVIKNDDDLRDLRIVFTFGKPSTGIKEIHDGIELVEVTAIPEWAEIERTNFLMKHPVLHNLISQFYHGLLKAYSDIGLARKISDSIGLQKIVTQSPFYRIPGEDRRRSLIQFLPADLQVRVLSKHPVLIECRDNDGKLQIYLVNYAKESQIIFLQFEKFVKVVGETLEGNSFEGEGSKLEIKIDVFVLLTVIL